MAAEFVMTRRVQFAETDIAGVLHFSNYYRMMEEVEHAFFRTLGLCVIQPDGDRVISWPRVATRCEYFAPALFEDELELSLTIAKMSTRSITYEVEFKKNGQRVALGQTTAVCCAMENSNFQAVPIPDSIRSKLAGACQAASDQTAENSGDRQPV